MTTQAETQLQVAVIGAGIAGLGACIALRKAGHDVELLEKSQFRSEIGAAMSVTPNGNLILKQWGFDFVRAGETPKVQNRHFAHDTLEIVIQNSYDHILPRYGSQFNAFHRVDLHTELRRLAESKDLPGSVSFRLGTDVQEIDCEAGLITLKDGTKLDKDLIVAADGIKSRFVEEINGIDVPRNFTGMSTHRALIDMEVVLKNETVGPIFAGQDSGFVHTVDPTTGVMLVTYPCRADKVLNYAIFHRAKDTDKGGDDWNAPADVNDVLAHIAHFHPFWIELTKCATLDSWKCFPVSKRDPLGRIVKGRAAIIGDAAHACLPTHAQGGSMAIEDAAALGVIFAGASREDVAKRLKLYEQLRLPRSATTQLVSNAMMYHRSGEETVEHIRQYYAGALPTGTMLMSPEICDFFFPYNVFKESEVALQYIDKPEGVPQDSMHYFGFAEPVGA